MQEHTFSHDPQIQRLVRDFDALADLLHQVIDPDRQAELQHAGMDPRSIEFTTEWQMVGAVEEAHSV